MGQVSLIHGLQYAGYGLELSLLILLLSPKRIKRFTALCAYVAALFGVDAVGRTWVLHHYGSKLADTSSYAYRVYFYSYYLSDLLLTLGVFLLVCALFRRACQDHEQVWKFIKPILMWVLLFVTVVAGAALKYNFSQLCTKYIYEFNQDLYFVCLVLNTVLYLMLQRFKAASDLSLLVCGLGVQLAGPAAGSALGSLMRDGGTILTYLSPICSLAMMAIWLFAITRKEEPEGASDPGTRRMGSSGKRRIVRPELVSPAIQLKPIATGGRHRRTVARTGALQAGYING